MQQFPGQDSHFKPIEKQNVGDEQILGYRMVSDSDSDTSRQYYFKETYNTISPSGEHSIQASVDQ